MPHVYVSIGILPTALLAACGGGEADLVQPGTRPPNSISTYNYHCSIHPTMRGTITVTP